MPFNSYAQCKAIEKYLKRRKEYVFYHIRKNEFVLSDCACEGCMEGFLLSNYIYMGEL